MPADRSKRTWSPAPPHSTFISFRRIRYPIASVAYRDLMLSGLSPWLSDHCISAPEALRVRSAPSELDALLRKQINNSADAIILADDGYFESAWTRLEFDTFLKLGRPMAIAQVGGAELPAHARERLTSASSVHNHLDEALAATCKRHGAELVPFSGDKLSPIHPMDADGYHFDAPDWFRAGDAPNSAITPWGDLAYWRVTPVSKTAPVAPEDAFEEFEKELWRQVERLAVMPRQFRIMGYHKFPVAGLNTTALGVSMQAVRASGFCRYVSMTPAGDNTRIELAVFVRGNLQRFHVMVPDIDGMIATLRRSHLMTAQSHALELARMKDWAQPVVWAQCKTCRLPTDADILAAGACPNCGQRVLECLTPHCPDRRAMDLATLGREAARETRQAFDDGQSSQSINDEGLLCEGCYASLFVPAGAITRLAQQPKFAISTVWSPRGAALAIWTLTAAFAVAFGPSPLNRAFFGLIGAMLVLETLDRRTRDERLPWTYVFAYLAFAIPAFALGGGQWWFDGGALTAATEPLPGENASALAAALTFCALACNAIGQTVRHRGSHLVYAGYIGVFVIIALVWRMANGEPLSAHWSALGITAAALVLSVLAAHIKLITGEFNPGLLWEKMRG